MNSEKVKEIKEYLKEELFIATKFEDKIRIIPTRDLQKILTLINELESENSELKKYRVDWLNGEKMHLQAEMEETEFELASSNRLFETVSKENKQLKNRIADLESENERLEKELKQVVLCNKGLQDGINEYQADNKEMGKSNQKLKERIAELEKENAKLLDSVETVQSNRCTTKCELTKKALKQFAERLKEVSHYTDEHGYFVVNFDDIDETLKEAIEDDKQ